MAGALDADAAESQFSVIGCLRKFRVSLPQSADLDTSSISPEVQENRATQDIIFMDRQLGVVIVNYNSFDDCSACVNSIINYGIVSSDDIVIVDNNSPDGSGQLLADQFTGIKVTLSQRNNGFGAGVNLGIAQLDANFYLILNPDTRFTGNNISEAIRLFLEEPKLGVLGLRLEYPDGSHQDSARRFFSWFTILLRRTPLGNMRAMRVLHDQHLMRGHWEHGAFETDWVAGAGFILRRTAFEAVGGMDEGYFLYLEDTDLCKRMWQSGWMVKAIPSVSLIHFHQREAAKSLFGKANRTFLRSLFRYLFKFGIPFFGHGKRY